ncbi:MAG: hypothetical protein K6T75_08655 [Acetobacteraceae bacterium]|nr:hypothetical protein [Acetobacteraceae bacterium]
MRLKGLKPVRIATAFLITLAVLGGAAYGWRLASCDRPLIRSLGSLPGVEEVRLERAGSRGLLIYVNLGPVADLRETYRALEERTGAVLGDGRFELIIRDTRTPALVEVYHRLHFLVQEGLETGRFADMDRRLEREVESLQALGRGPERYRVWVDDRHLYVELHQGRSALYEVISRARAGPAEGGAEG